MPEVPVTSGSYREITSALAQRIQGQRTDAGAALEWLQEPIEILIPSHGVADAIVGVLLRSFPHGVTGIRLQTPDALALQILNRAGRFPRVASPGDRRLAMLAAAAEIRDERLNTPAIAVALERSYRDIRDSGVTLAAFRQNRERSGDKKRAAEIADAWRRYESILARCSTIDPADAIHQAIEALGNTADAETRGRGDAGTGSTSFPASPRLPVSASGGAVGPQIIFGFYDMTGIQEMLLQALHHAGKIDSFYIPVYPEDSRYSFAQRHLSEVRRIASFSGNGDGETGRQGEKTANTQILSPSPCLPVPVSLLTWSIHKYATPIEEARETAREIRALIDQGVDPRRIAIVMRSLEPHSIAALHRSAAEFDFTLSTSPTRPLGSHPFGRALRLLLQIREQRFPRSAVVELAATPFKSDFWGFPVNSQRLDSSSRRAEVAGGPSSWVKASLARIETETPRELEEITNYLRVLEKVEKLTEPLNTRRRGARWAETIDTLADAFALRSEQDLLALDALRDIASTCRRFDPSGVLIPPDTILQLLESQDDLSPSPPRPLSPSVWLGDVMKARGRTFAHLFLLDMRDGAFPQSRSEDPLVTNHERRAAGVREISDGREEERLLFQLLLDAAETAVHFAWPSSDGVRRVYYASHFLKEFAQQNEPDPDLKFLALRNFSAYLRDKQQSRYGERASSPAVPGVPPGTSDRPQRRVEKRIAALQAAPSIPESLTRRIELLSHSGTRSRFDSYLDLTDALKAAIDTKLALISPTQLEYYGQCPQRFLFTSILGIGEIEDPEHELQISIRKKGGLDHGILEVFYRTLNESDFQAVAASAGALPDVLQQRLDHTIDAEFRRHDADYPAPNQMIREVERKLTRRFLTDFVREDLRDLAATGFRPESFEYQFGPSRTETTPDHDPVPLNLGDRVIMLKGKMDRVDRNQAEAVVRIIDYKSGKGLKYRKLADTTRKGRSLQLGFYALAAAKIFGILPDKIVASIKPLRLIDADETHSFALGAILDDLTATLQQLGTSINTGLFPAFPDVYCDYCAVGAWCRVKHDPQQRHALKRYDFAVDLLTSESDGRADGRRGALHAPGTPVGGGVRAPHTHQGAGRAPRVPTAETTDLPPGEKK